MWNKFDWSYINICQLVYGVNKIVTFKLNNYDLITFTLEQEIFTIFRTSINKCVYVYNVFVLCKPEYVLILFSV